MKPVNNNKVQGKKICLRTASTQEDCPFELMPEFSKMSEGENNDKLFLYGGIYMYIQIVMYSVI